MVPIVLHHGFMGFPNLKAGPYTFKYFRRIDRALLDRGHPVIVTRVHPTAGVATRARQLKEIILRQLEILGRRDQKVVIVGHSMGGLDARYMISRLGMEDRVSALLTVTAPHRGTSFADWCMRYLGQKLGVLRLMTALGLDVQGVNDLTTESCRRFNEVIFDSPAVRYFSVSAARPWTRVPPFALHAFKVIQEAEGDNDGLVSVRSSTWGQHSGRVACRSLAYAQSSHGAGADRSHRGHYTLLLGGAGSDAGRGGGVWVAECFACGSSRC